MTTNTQPKEELVVSNNHFMAKFMEYVRDDIFFRLLGHEPAEENGVANAKEESGIFRAVVNEKQYQQLLRFAKDMYDLQSYLARARDAGLQDRLHLCSVDPEHTILAKLVGAFCSRIRYPEWKDNPLSVDIVAEAKKTTNGVFLYEVSRSVVCALSHFGYSSQFEGDPHQVALSIEKWLSEQTHKE
jgi:hypothetical protein